MNKERVICPVCGSEATTFFEKKGSMQLTLGEQFFFDDSYYKCNSCKEEGDFSGQRDKNYLNAQKEAQVGLVKQILDYLNHHGFTMAMLERVFELPARTLTRWKSGDFSSSALALLRIIRTYPWIIEVVERRFEPSFVAYSLMRAGIDELEQESKKNNLHAKVVSKSVPQATSFAASPVIYVTGTGG